MAYITLATLRGYWQNVSDWVKGVDSTSSPKVTVSAALPTGTNIMGKVGIDQSTPGTTNGVQINAGTAIMGKVGIDQTTPGTTNGVQINAALPAGTNILGNVGIDQTTPGTTNGVQVNSALPAGSNTIGRVRTSGPNRTFITTATTTTIKTGPGVLCKILNAGTAVTGAITVFDNTTGSGSKIWATTSGNIGATFDIQCPFTTGLTIITAAADTLTVIYE